MERYSPECSTSRTSIRSVGLTVWAVVARPLPKRGRLIFVLALLGLLVVRSFGADDGARMVYDYDAVGNACSQPIEFTK